MIPKVYILDSDVEYASLLKGICRADGIAVEVSSSPERFLFALPEEGVLLLNLEGLSCGGMDVIKALGSSSSKLQLIIMSSYDSGVLHSAKCKARANAVPVLACFNKPLMVPPLMQAIKRGLAQAQVSMEPPDGFIVPEHNQLVSIC